MSASSDKCCAATMLTGPARRVHRSVLAAFAHAGRAPGRADLARLADESDASPQAVFAELSERDVIAFGPDGEIRAAYPFSATPTSIRVSWPGGPLAYAMCAIDALGISAMLGCPVTITAAEPGTGRLITVETEGDRARWTPRTAVVFAGSAGDACRSSADRTCGYINFFTSRRAAREWAGRYPQITGRTLSRPAALACGVAEFGTLLRDVPAEFLPARWSQASPVVATVPAPRRYRARRVRRRLRP